MGVEQLREKRLRFYSELETYKLQSKLLKGGYIGDYIANYYRGYSGRY